jgi:hypothetical protein
MRISVTIGSHIMISIHQAPIAAALRPETMAGNYNIKHTSKFVDLCTNGFRVLD